MRDNVTIRHVYLCSTGHISPQTRDWLDEQSKKITDLHDNPQGPWPALHLYPSTYGWMIFLGDENDGNHLEWPADLRAIAARAFEANAPWIELDCDGDVIEGLQTWDW